MAKMILLVEPSLTTRKVVELAFEEEDVEIAFARTGAEALEQIEKVRPTAILASFTLPDMSGIEFCRAVRRTALGGQLPVVLLVARGERYDENDARAAGVSARLDKPVDSQELVELVGQYAVEEEEEVITPPPVGETPPRKVESLGSVSPLVEEKAGPEEVGKGLTEMRRPPTGEPPPVEVVSLEAGVVERQEEETDFERSLQALSKDILSADEASREPQAAPQPVEPPRELEDRKAEVEAEGSEAGIVLEKASDEEIEGTILGDRRSVPVVPTAQRVPPEGDVQRTEVEEAERGPKREEAEADLIERLIGKRVWEFTVESVRRSMQQTLDRISPEIIKAVRDEVRVLFPDLAERIIREEIDKLKKGLES